MYTAHIEYQTHTWLLHMHSYMSDTLMRIILIAFNIYIKSPWNPWSPPFSLRGAGRLPILLAKPSSNLVLLLKPPSFFSKSQISRDLPKLPSVREFYPIYSHSRHIFPFGSPKSPTFSRQNPAWHTSSVSCRCSAKAFLRRSISASRCSTMAWLRRGRILVPMALNGLEIEDSAVNST